MAPRHSRASLADGNAAGGKLELTLFASWHLDISQVLYERETILPDQLA